MARPAPSASLRRRARPAVAVTTAALLLALQLAPLRRARAEDRLDFKYLYYQEDDGRIQVTSPAALLEKDLSPLLSIKIEGIYNAISGASPTGAPLVTDSGVVTPAATAPYSVYVEESEDNERSGRAEDRDDDEDEDDEGEERERRGDDEEEGGVLRLKRGSGRGFAVGGPTRRLRGLHAVSGASQQAPAPEPTPAPAPANTSSSSSGSRSSDRSSSSAGSGSTAAPAPTPVPSQTRLPRAKVEDERVALNVELNKRFDGHTLTGTLSLSSETDYDSVGVSLRDSIEFNKKNTTLEVGGAYTHDEVEAFTRSTTEDKNTLEGLLGLTQVLSPRTLFTLTLTLGQVEGYLDDQYKVVALNDVLVPEKRPESKDKQIVYTSLTRFIEAMQGSAELGYRFYTDTFGIQAHTFTLAWHQKLGRQLILSPMVRWYTQSEADFYDVSFSGSPTYYSSDYRVSALEALGYGVKLVWRPTSSWSLDLAAERYEQEGTDGITPQEAYPAANILSGGVRLWF